MVERILIPLDGSGFSEAALPTAEALARACGARLHLASVLEMPPIFAYPDVRSEDRVRLEGYLERVAADIGGIEVSWRVREGHIGPELLHEIQDWGADLVVLTSHGRGGLSRLWLGSITDQLVRSADRPILLVRPTEGDAQRPPSFAVRRVCVPLDGSELAAQALPLATGMARAFGAVLDLVRVVGYLPATDLTSLNPAGELDVRMIEAVRSEAEASLVAVAERLAAEGVAVRYQLVTSLQPARAILDHAGDDLIVMTTRGMGGVRRSILGSVTDKVARSAHGPVLIVPAGVAHAS